MALRSALCQLAPKLMGSAQAAAPLATKAFGFAQQFSQVLSQQEKPRSFATDAVKVMKGEPSVAAADILSKTPTHYIDYDDHAHARFEPGTEGRPFAYFVQTGGRFFYASAARLAILKAVVSLSAAADTLAISSLEVDLSGLEEGSQMTVKWRGKPVFIKHRTDAEIASLSTTNLAELRDQQTDAQRALNPKYLVIVGICTHLGCVPIAGAGNYEGGWFCPCHGSHYDGSGRIREGPAPFNLEVPEYRFLDEKKIVIG